MTNNCIKCGHQWEDDDEPGHCPQCNTWNQSERFKESIRNPSPKPAGGASKADLEFADRLY